MADKPSVRNLGGWNRGNTAGFSVLCEALANGDEAMAIDIISTDVIYKFGRVHIVET
jgi:hypothetical protein